MNPRYDLPDVSRRLIEVLIDLGYSVDRGGKARACRVINRKTLRPMKDSRFLALCNGEGAAMTAEEARQVADGLSVDVRRILYDTPPIRPEKPGSFLDELDEAGRVRY